MKSLRSSVIAVSILLMLLAFGCDSQGLLHRTVELSIPIHPWESNSGRQFWYNLEIFGNNCRSSLFVPQGTRSVTIRIPLGEAVTALAYPMGSGTPQGAWISPETGRQPVKMNQMDGVILESLTKIDNCWNDLNYPKLAEMARQKTMDFREIARLKLIEDIANGEINSDSIRLKKSTRIDHLELPSGLWYGEFAIDGSIYSSASQKPSISMNTGTRRYYNFQRNLVLSIFFADDGKWNSTITAGLIPFD